MRVRVKEYGHQHFAEYVGHVLAWLQTVEIYAEHGGKAMQVPCVLLRTDDGAVLVVPLKTQMRWTEVTVLEDPTKVTPI